MSAIQLSSILNNNVYTENFNTLRTSGAATWVNDSTLNGWYTARTGTGTQISTTNGSTSTGNLYSFGTVASSDRALGSIGSSGSSAGSFFWGVRFVNNTDITLDFLNINYIGEQWRNSGAGAQTVDFQYQVGATSITGGTWIDANNLDFTSPVTGGTATALDGNAAANRTSVSGKISGLNLAPGQEIWLRWRDIDHTGSDHGLAIDDFSLSFGTFGTNGNDTLQGDDFEDYIDGLAGNDIITGLKGDDILIGGGGNDQFIINAGDGTDTITDFGGAGNRSNPSSSIRAEMDLLKFQGTGMTAQNMLLTQNGTNLEITFEGVADTKVILQNFQMQNLNNFREALLSQPKIGNILFEGDGNTIQDVYDVYTATQTDRTNYKNNAVTFLNNLDNYYVGLNGSNDVINGQGGNDTIYGLSGNDILRGGDGNDILVGGLGNDILVGGSGNDLFVLQAKGGTDIIRDFVDGQDLIGLAGGLTFGQLTITQGTGVNINNTLITITSTSELIGILNGVVSNNITDSDFTAFT
ncbi:calcium-binding protein [Anabaena subtropica]|uniref:Hemolysin-type calcium-binding protein n=1 Tax=Anabaena subtropica FACHB-260 TaxID=2692884 RepID=A0ABR8CMR1_9NOST|nr:hemolysin-type calcium-binding protein [Anabaena subtropica]MBD2344522.1 hemolysin-type calcium-binding protein [Anabaena subtropica FACHB-260]